MRNSTLPELDPNRLHNVKPGKCGQYVARCPACAEDDHDKSGNHLLVFPDGKFSCIHGKDDAEHRKRIYALAAGSRATHAAPAPRPAPVQPTAPAKPARTFPTLDAAAAACCPNGATVEAVYNYNAADGSPFGGVARYREGGGGKTFRQFHPAAGSWQTGKPAGLWPLYGLHGIKPQGPVFIVEGEKCQAAVSALGLCAVTSAGGSAAPGGSDWGPLAGRSVFILPDADAPGEKYAAAVTDALRALPTPAKVRRIELPGLAALGQSADVCDWAASHPDWKPSMLRTELEILAKEAAAASEDATGTPRTQSLTAWLAAPDVPEQPLVAGLFDRGDRVALVAQSKAGKSFLALQLALAVGTGRPFLRFDVTKARVLLTNLEIKASCYKGRLRKMAGALGIEAGELGDVYIMHGRGESGVTFATILAAAKECGAALVVIDPFYRLLPGDESDQVVVKEAVAEMEKFAAAGIALVNVFHTPKGRAGDRQVIDLVSGSGVFARDADSLLALLPHKRGREYRVLTGELRNFPMFEAPTLRFDGAAFAVVDDVAAEIETTATANRKRAIEIAPKQVGALLAASGSMNRDQLEMAVRDKLGVGMTLAKRAVAAASEAGAIVGAKVGRFTWYSVAETAEQLEIPTF
jgi:hypothetical protein